jgi:CheY-like chemotaxis protein
VRISTERNEQGVRLWIEDNGIGIEKESRQRLFELFQRVHKNSYPGTGIGLAIVRKAVERTHGQVGVESEPGKGSRFLAATPGERGVTTNSRCVLLAEDDPNDVLLLQHAFKQAQVQTPLVAVDDGQEVVDYLLGLGSYSDRNRYPLPRLLVLDLKMPRKSGIDVLEWLKSHEMLRCLPTIMLSSSAHPMTWRKPISLALMPSSSNRREFQSGPIWPR